AGRRARGLLGTQRGEGGRDGRALRGEGLSGSRPVPRAPTDRSRARRNARGAPRRARSGRGAAGSARPGGEAARRHDAARRHVDRRVRPGGREAGRDLSGPRRTRPRLAQTARGGRGPRHGVPGVGAGEVVSPAGVLRRLNVARDLGLGRRRGARQSRDSFYRPPPVAPGRRRARPRRDAHGGTRHRSGRHGGRRARICRRRRRDARGRDFGLPGPAATRRDHGHRGNRHRRAGPRRVRAPPHAGARPAAAGRPAGECQRDFPGGDGHSRSPASAGRLPVRRPHGRAPVVRRSGGPSLGRARRSDVSLGPPGRAGGGAPAQRGGAVTARSRPLGLDRSFGGLLSPSMARGAIASLGPALALVGLANGVLITGLRVVPFIATLGMLGIARGVAKWMAHEQTVNVPPTWLNDLVVTFPRAAWMVLSPGVWITLALAVLTATVLRRTVFGRRVFAVGSNELAARACGIATDRLKITIYGAAGLLFGLAGVVQLSGLRQGDPTVAIGTELAVIAAVAVRGGSLQGGEGSVFGSVVGALIMAFLRNGCQQMGWPNYIQEIIIGSIIVLAVALDRVRARRAA